jgi:hypothetical protein
MRRKLSCRADDLKSFGVTFRAAADDVAESAFGSHARMPPAGSGIREPDSQIEFPVYSPLPKLKITKEFRQLPRRPPSRMTAGT